MNGFLEIVEGAGPVLLGQPHGGTELVPDVAARLNPTGLALADTDWHIARLYDGLLSDATVVRARLSRYVIDVNRDPAGTTLYPGQNTTGLCPATDFDGRPLYKAGQEPDADEIEARRAKFHDPYHAAMQAQIERLRARHGQVLLFDCHSIRSLIPFLFEGRLAVFNLGTNDGKTANPALQQAAQEACRTAQAADGHDWVLNGRFKGGWTTRHYGRPADGVHAVQLELAQRAYMDEQPPWNYLAGRAEGLRGHLRRLLEALRGALPK